MSIERTLALPVNALSDKELKAFLYSQLIITPSEAKTDEVSNQLEVNKDILRKLIERQKYNNFYINTALLNYLQKKLNTFLRQCYALDNSEESIDLLKKCCAIYVKETLRIIFPYHALPKLTEQETQESLDVGFDLSPKGFARYIEGYSITQTTYTFVKVPVEQTKKPKHSDVQGQDKEDKKQTTPAPDKNTKDSDVETDKHKDKKKEKKTIKKAIPKEVTEHHPAQWSLSEKHAQALGFNTGISPKAFLNNVRHIIRQKTLSPLETQTSTTSQSQSDSTEKTPEQSRAVSPSLTDQSKEAARQSALFDETINVIRKRINEYKGTNKKSKIDQFNTHLDGLNFYKTLQEKKDSLYNALYLLQKSEQTYYKKHVWFFKERQQKNSSLQPLIQEAKKIFDDYNEQGLKSSPQFPATKSTNGSLKPTEQKKKQDEAIQIRNLNYVLKVISRTLNEEQDQDKKYLLDLFNSRIQYFLEKNLDTITKKDFCEILKSELELLLRGENKHYEKYTWHGFFASLRKSQSTLSLRIAEAQEILTQYQSSSNSAYPELELPDLKKPLDQSKEMIDLFRKVKKAKQNKLIRAEVKDRSEMKDAMFDLVKEMTEHEIRRFTGDLTKNEQDQFLEKVDTKKRLGKRIKTFRV